MAKTKISLYDPVAANNTDINSTNIATTAFVQTKVGTLGTISTQNANAVAITGGTINSISLATFGNNSTGTKTVSTSVATGGSDGAAGNATSGNSNITWNTLGTVYGTRA